MPFLARWVESAGPWSCNQHGSAIFFCYLPLTKHHICSEECMLELTSSSQTPPPPPPLVEEEASFKNTQKSWGKTKIWSCVSTGPETKTECADEDQQQFTRPTICCPESWNDKVWSWVSQALEPRMTGLASISSNVLDTTRPRLVLSNGPNRVGGAFLFTWGRKY
jgi:hypothetical protein